MTNTLQETENSVQEDVGAGEISRRGFLGVGAAMAGAMAAMAVGCTPATASEESKQDPSASSQLDAATALSSL